MLGGIGGRRRRGRQRMRWVDSITDLMHMSLGELLEKVRKEDLFKLKQKTMRFLVLSFNSVQSLSRVQLFGSHGLQHGRPPCPSPTPGACSNSRPLSQWCHPTISSSVIPFSSHLQSFPASGSFSIESVLPIRWPKYWSFSFNISPSNEHPGLISFMMDWLDLLSVQGTLKSLLQHHSSETSILRCSAFFTVQLFLQHHSSKASIL